MNPPESLRPYKVYAIEEGTVIDHIPGGKALKVIEILKLNDYDNTLTFGVKFDSKKMGKKDIIKIEHKELTKDELNKIAIVAPQASINIIQNFEKIKKFNVELPTELHNIVRCPNPNCITNHERDLRTHFIQNNGVFTCFYCETQDKPHNLELL